MSSRLANLKVCIQIFLLNMCFEAEFSEDSFSILKILIGLLVPELHKKMNTQSSVVQDGKPTQTSLRWK